MATSGWKSMTTNADSVAGKPWSQRTVREHLDHNIQQKRQELEALCIAKAKAETMQLLEIPIEFMQSIWYPF